MWQKHSHISEISQWRIKSATVFSKSLVCMQQIQNASVRSITLGSLCYSSLLVSITVCFSTQGGDKDLLVFRLTRQNFPFPLNPPLFIAASLIPALSQGAVCSLKGERQWLPLSGDFFQAAPLRGPCGPYGSRLTKAVLIGSSALSSVVPLFSGGWNADWECLRSAQFDRLLPVMFLRLEREKELNRGVR